MGTTEAFEAANSAQVLLVKGVVIVVGDEGRTGNEFFF